MEAVQECAPLPLNTLVRLTTNNRVNEQPPLSLCCSGVSSISTHKGREFLLNFLTTCFCRRHSSLFSPPASSSLWTRCRGMVTRISLYLALYPCYPRCFTLKVFHYHIGPFHPMMGPFYPRELPPPVGEGEGSGWFAPALHRRIEYETKLHEKQ